MEITLFDNGEIFYKSNQDLIDKSNFKSYILDSYKKIVEYNNKSFIIKYDNCAIFSFESNLILLGTSNDYNFIIKDLFLRNILFKYIYTNDIKFLESFKQYSFKITTLNDKYEVEEGNIKRALFSGGCFWCMAHPYYTFKGVLNVLSGYAGGKSLNPKYLDVKHGNGYRETILVIYDEDKICYKELLKLYFESIDPFDSEGQFIDKGYSYTTCIYAKSASDLFDFNNYKDIIESKYNLKVKVKVEGDSIFYLAESEHQEFEFHFKERFLKEEKESGRDSFSFIDID